MPIIASLSAVPSRFADLQPVLKALLRQDARLEEVRLYLPKRYRRFPDYDGSLPTVPKGVRIIQVDEDLGPASKVLFAARDLKDEDCDIFYCDDDHIYARDWVSRMIRHRGDRLEHCICTVHETISIDGQPLPQRRLPLPQSRPTMRLNWLQRRARRVAGRIKKQRPIWELTKRTATGGYVDVACGMGGVLVRPAFFDAQFYEIPSVIWAVDDYWLAGHFARKNIPIWVAPDFRWPQTLASSGVDALYLSVTDGAARAEANAACVRYMQDTYGIWQP